MILTSILIGGSIAFVPALPWYRLGDNFQTASAILLLPGYLIDYVATGPHGMVIQRIVAMNCIIYPSVIYWFVDGVPTVDDAREGPMAAVERFLDLDPGFERDYTREVAPSFNPGSWLKRK